MLVVNPNICVDHTIAMEELMPGHVQRPRSGAVSLGGKGVNVARVARSLDDRATIVSVLPQGDEDQLMALARLEGADLRGPRVEGNARGATIILEDSGRVTVLNEPGVVVSERDWDDLLGEVRSLSPQHRTIVCSGSLPPGSPSDSYARVVRTAHDLDMRCVVDSAGEILRAAAEAGADAVSPNLAEAESLLFGSRPEGVDPSGPDVAERAARCVQGLAALGARHVIVSAGSNGAAFDLEGQVAWCTAPRVNVLNPIGAGDSLIGGLVHALERGDSWPAAVRFALCTASASCEQVRAGGIEPQRIAELMSTLDDVTVLADFFVTGRAS